jgi:hypothetical protein
MPQLRAPGVDRLALPSDPEAWVEMKHRASYGDKTAAQEAMVNVSVRQAGQGRSNGKKRNQMVVVAEDGRELLNEFETQAYMLTLLQRLITAWNFTDERGETLAINRTNLELLDAEDGDFLEREAKIRIGGRPVDQQGPSKTPSSESSRPMEGGLKIVKQPGS